MKAKILIAFIMSISVAGYTGYRIGVSKYAYRTADASAKTETPTTVSADLEENLSSGSREISAISSPINPEPLDLEEDFAEPEYFQQAKAEQDPIARKGAFYVALANMTPENAHEVYGMFYVNVENAIAEYHRLTLGQEGSDADRNRATEIMADMERQGIDFFHKWGQMDGASAFNALLDLGKLRDPLADYEPGGESIFENGTIDFADLDNIAKGLLSGWSENDPQGAVNSLYAAKDNSLLEEQYFGDFLGDVYNNWMATDPNSAISSMRNRLNVFGLGEDGEYLDALFVEPQLALQSGIFEEVLNKLNTESGGENQAEAIAYIFEELMSRDADAAYEFLNLHLEEPGLDIPMRDIGQQLGTELSMGNAQNWLSRISDDKKGEFIAGYVDGMSDTDLMGAGIFINSLPLDFPGLDDIYHSYAREFSWYAEDKQASLEWALAIEDPETRNKALSDVGNNWRQRASESYDQWINSGNTGYLTEEEYQLVTGKSSN